MPEVAGNGALYVNPFDVSEIRKGIKQIIEDEDLREKLTEHGKQNLKRFQPEVIAKKYAELYEIIINE